MMLAETAYNVIQALPEGERTRLIKMLGLQENEVVAKPAKQDPHWSTAQAKEYIVNFYARIAERRSNKKPGTAIPG